jgi:hypothetical protein
LFGVYVKHKAVRVTQFVFDEKKEEIPDSKPIIKQEINNMGIQIIKPTTDKNKSNNRFILRTMGSRCRKSNLVNHVLSTSAGGIFWHNVSTKDSTSRIRTPDASRSIISSFILSSAF